MNDFDPEKLLAEMAAEEAKLSAEMEKLGLGTMAEFADMDAWHGFPEIVRAAHEVPEAALIETFQTLIAEGADVNARSPYGETAVMQCFARSAFEAVRFLIDNGADVSEFEWSAADLEIVQGRVPGVAAGSPALTARNGGGRSLFLQACRAANRAAAAHLEPITPPEAKVTTPGGDGPVTMAVLSGSLEMVEWVLAQGYDVNAADRFGATALLEAAERDLYDIAECLLKAGADLSKGNNLSASNAAASEDDEVAQSMFGKAAQLITDSTAKLVPAFLRDMDDTVITPAEVARSPELLRLFARYGAPLESFDAEDLPAVTGADQIAKIDITPEMFNAQSMPRDGRMNPEHVEIPFWREQIRTGRTGYAGEVACKGARTDPARGMPVWSFDRFGRTGTLLPDGRWVLIAGEHEDHYDPDFCIYSDVTVITPDAGAGTQVDHFIYPADVFPPTDFHSATLVGDHILLIGSLSYPHLRDASRTQVLRLSLKDFSISTVATTGQNPGWISRHKATLEGGHIIVSGGQLAPDLRENEGVFALDLATRVWSRAR